MELDGQGDEDEDGIAVELAHLDAAVELDATGELASLAASGDVLPALAELAPPVAHHLDAPR